MPFKAMGLHPSLVQATREMRYTEPTPDPGRGHPRHPRRPRPHRHRPDRHRQDRRLPAADPAPAPAPCRAAPPRRWSHADARAGPADRRRLPGPGLSHAVARSASWSAARRWGRRRRRCAPASKSLVATPGRLLDHMRQNQARFDQLHTLVLDEADRMLDMGFLPDLKRIIARLPARKQTLLFSATMPPVIAKLAAEILQQPADDPDRPAQRPGGRHHAGGLPGGRAPQDGPAAPPAAAHRNAVGAGVHAHQAVGQAAGATIAADGFAVAELHSNLTQPQRNRAMEGFRRGDFQVLVATNIAARGLDVDAHHARHQLRRAARCRRTTSTASAAPAGPRRRATPSCWCRRRRRSRWRRSSGTSASGCRASRCRTSTTARRRRRVRCSPREGRRGGRLRGSRAIGRRAPKTSGGGGSRGRGRR